MKFSEVLFESGEKTMMQSLYSPAELTAELNRTSSKDHFLSGHPDLQQAHIDLILSRSQSVETQAKALMQTRKIFPKD